MTSTHSDSPTLALVRDLLFSSRITATARSLGISVKILRDPQQLEAENRALLIVDLNHPGAIEAAAQWQQRTSGKTVGFVSHVDNVTIERAREAGIDRVLARSAFVEQLPQILRGESD